MENLQWIFDGPPPSGMEIGGDAVAHVFNKGDRDAELHTFVREVIQNSNDRRLDERNPVENPVRISFDFFALKGDERDAFMEAIGWEEGLKAHLAAAAETGSVAGARIERELTEVEKRQELRLLRITDSGTEGLTGGENESGGNFKSLCKDILKRPEGGKGKGGGSFGLGKAVLWGFSGVATVLFFSELATPEDGRRRRLFGRSSLASHTIAPDQDFAGQGFFGESGPGVNNSKDLRAISVWDCDRELLGKLMLDRDSDQGPGTSILIIDFDEPADAMDRDLLEVADQLNLSVQRWWWPSLESGTLEVEINVIVGGQRQGPDSQEVKVTDEGLQPYLRAWRSENSRPELKDVGDVLKAEVTVDVPERHRNAFGTTPDPGGVCDVTLCLTAAEESEGLRGRVAYVRGSGMVIEYKEFPTRADLGFSVCGVLKAGLIDGDRPEEEQERLEAFLRAAEPPAHDKLVVTDRLRADYSRGFGVALDKLDAAVRTKVLDSSTAPVPSGTTAPDALTRLLKVGRIGTDPVKGKLTLSKLKRESENGNIKITGRVHNSRPWIGDDQSWKVILSLLVHWEGGGNGPALNIETAVVAGETIPLNTGNGGGTVQASVNGPHADFILIAPEPAEYASIMKNVRIDTIVDLCRPARDGN